MIGWRRMLSAPEVVIDPASRVYEIFLRRFARPGLKYHLLLTTLDIHVHSFLGVLIDQRKSRLRIVVGGSANLDAEVAATKTLCELAQGLTWIDQMSEATEVSPSGAGDVTIPFGNIRNFTDRARLYGLSPPQGAFDFLLGTAKRVDLS